MTKQRDQTLVLSMKKLEVKKMTFAKIETVPTKAYQKLLIVN